jgi:hypothetical protein
MIDKANLSGPEYNAGKIHRSPGSGIDVRPLRARWLKKRDVAAQVSICDSRFRPCRLNAFLDLKIPRGLPFKWQVSAPHGRSILLLFHLCFPRDGRKRCSSVQSMNAESAIYVH